MCAEITSAKHRKPMATQRPCHSPASRPLVNTRSPSNQSAASAGMATRSKDCSSSGRGAAANNPRNPPRLNHRLFTESGRKCRMIRRIFILRRQQGNSPRQVIRSAAVPGKVSIFDESHTKSTSCCPVPAPSSRRVARPDPDSQRTRSKGRTIDMRDRRRYVRTNPGEGCSVERRRPGSLKRPMPRKSKGSRGISEFAGAV